MDGFRKVTPTLQQGDRDVPAEASPGPWTLDVVGDRHSLIMIGMLGVWLACAVFAAARLLVTLRTGKLTPWWANAVGAVAMTALYLWYRRRPDRRSSGAASGTALVATVALLIPVPYGMASTVWWLGLVGFAMVLLGRRREAWVWGLAIPTVVTLASLVEPFVQLSGAAGEPPLERGLARIAFVVLLVGMAAAFRGVAERRASALHESDERYRMLFQRVPVSVFHCDQDLLLTDCNQRFAAVVGQTRESVIGRNLGAFADERILPSVFAALQGGKGAYDGPYGDPSDACARFVSVRAVPLYRSDGEVVGALGIVEDVTDRLRMEDELRRSHDELEQRVEARTEELRTSRELLGTILGSIPQQVAWKSTASVYLGCNRQFAEAAGLGGTEEIVGKTDFDLRWRDRASDYIAEDREIIASRRPMRKTQPDQFAGGRQAWVSVTKLPLIDETGSVFAVLGVFEDITERTTAELRLARSELNYRTIFDEANDAVVVFEPENETILDANRGACQIYGYARDELIGMSMKALTKDVARGEESLRRALAHGNLSGFESTHLTRDGREVTFLINCSLIEFEGRPAVLSMNREITDRKVAEAALRESEDRYRSLFEQSPLGIYRATTDGSIVAANRALLRKLGFASVEELASHNPKIEEYAPSHLRTEFATRIEADGEVLAFETTWLTREGQALHVRESARAVRDQEGRTLYYEGTVEDVTAERLADEERRRLVAAIEQATETIMITDTDGRIEYVNPAFERMTGYTREDAIGRTAAMIKSGKHDKAYYAELWRTITRGETWEGHFINRRKDGTLFEEDATISPVRDREGRVVNFVCVKRDVTKEMALQAQLREAQKMETVGQLAGGVAHDFNNILQAMLASAQVARMDGGVESITAAVEELQSEVHRGAALTRQLLLFARRLPAEHRPLDLATLIDDHAKMLRRLLPENISIAVDSNGGDYVVEGDAAQLGQVLINLAVNARDAMPTGGKLHLRLSRRAERVVVSVSDSGGGMTAETREHLFEPFFTTKAVGKGTGLGLAVVWGIVNEHGGTVEVESEPGHGATFRVVLPAARSSPTAEPHPEDAVPVGHGQSVLLIEDNDIVRRSVAKQLVKLGYEVTDLSSGEEAIALPGEPPIDILLTDYSLTGATGLEVAKRLKKRWPRLKVVLMSGYASEQLGRELEPGGFLQKPFSLEALARALWSTGAVPSALDATDED